MPTILVVAAHPDDELLGVGGTVVHHVARGDSVYACILGQGLLARDDADKTGFTVLRESARRAGSVIGFKEIFFGDLPDNSFDIVRFLDIVKKVEEYVSKLRPAVVYTHHEYDLNVDHRLTAQAVLTACRPCHEHCPEEIYEFETLSSTEWQSKDSKQFAPNVYVNIEDTLQKKIAALGHYVSEMRDYPHSRSLEGVEILAKWRGLESNLRAAEAYRLVRRIDRGQS